MVPLFLERLDSYGTCRVGAVTQLPTGDEDDENEHDYPNGLPHHGGRNVSNRDVLPNHLFDFVRKIVLRSFSF
jgi:hypothetical protein